jgi:hypothetical protein
MTLTGVLRDDEKTLNTGSFQVLEGATDKKGRSIVMFYPWRLIDEHIHTNEGITRMVWYLAHAGLENEASQKYGVVILLCVGKLRLGQTNHPLEKMLIDSIQGALPVRLSALHICRPPSFVWVVWPIIKMFVSARTAKRFLFHWGDDAKIRKILEGFGIEETQLPAFLGGSFQHDHYEWLAKRRAAGK